MFKDKESFIKSGTWIVSSLFSTLNFEVGEAAVVYEGCL